MPLIEQTLFDEIVAYRRDVHENPELSWQEHRTAEQIERFLDRHGIAHRRLAGTGIVADLPGEAEGPLVALRADTDALPIQEATGLPFSSQVNGVMHACGHDGHSAMLLGAAAMLAREERLPAPVRLIFQPAEETGRGALAVIEAGGLEGVAMIFGGHLDRHFEVGSIAVTDGPVNASSDRFRFSIHGRGGHAARPHEAIDAVVVGSLIVMAIQTIVSREVNPAHPSVVTVGRFDAGTAANVIAAEAVLEGTIRAQDPEVRTHLQTALKRIGESIAQLHGTKIDVEILEGTPAVINGKDITALARTAAVQAVGEERVVEMTIANMGGEDFSHYLEHVPGCYVRFGSRVPGKEGFPAHSNRFDFHEDALAVGAAYYYEVARVAGRHVAARALAESER
jgi:hippurate hydrolase